MKKRGLLIMILMLVILSGCARVNSEVKINSDFSGKWNSIIIAEAPLQKTEIEKILVKNQINNYKLKSVKKDGHNNNDFTSSIWDLDLKFSSAEELTQIVRTLQSQGNSLLSDRAIFQDPNDSNLYILDFGFFPGETKIYIDGEIIPGTVSVPGERLGKNSIIYIKGEKISFKFKPSGGTFFKLGVGIGMFVLAITSYYIFKRRRNKLIH